MLEFKGSCTPQQALPGPTSPAAHGAAIRLWAVRVVRVWPVPSLPGHHSGSGMLALLWVMEQGGDRYYQSGSGGHVLSDLWLVCHFSNRGRVKQEPKGSLLNAAFLQGVRPTAGPRSRPYLFCPRCCSAHPRLALAGYKAAS